MFKIIVFFTLFSILFSCKNEKHVEADSVLIANVDNLCSSEFKKSTLFKKITAIVLSNKDVMLVEISKMLVFDGKLYILDRKSQGVYAFQNDGSFISKFGNLGIAPGEYISCTDFAINTDANEICIFDMLKNRIHKYDAFSGVYKESVDIDKKVNVDYISYYEGYLYAAQTSNRNEDGANIYYLLHQIDLESGKELSRCLDAVSYNKGWNDELIHGNIFYNVGEGQNLFVLGLMDTIMYIKNNRISPFLAINSERLIKKEDIKEEEKLPTSNPRLRSQRMMSLLARLSAQNRIYQISNLFSHNEKLYFNCMGRLIYFVEYDEIQQKAFVYSRVVDDILFKSIPDHFQVPSFLCSDDMGVYYKVPNENLAELKYFMNNDYLSEKVENSECIGELNENSNPIVLYYEYED